MLSSRTVLKLTVCASLTMTLGCASFWHELKPHRMQRWNRGPAPSLDPEFSFRQLKPSQDLASRKAVSSSATLSVNTAEVAVVRAQSPANSVERDLSSER